MKLIGLEQLHELFKGPLVFQYLRVYVTDGRGPLKKVKQVKEKVAALRRMLVELAQKMNSF